MHFNPYVYRVALQAGLTLACSLPFGLVAARHSRTRRWGLLLFVASLIVLNAALLEIPRVDGFQRRHWSWQEFVLSSAWPFLWVALVPGISLATIGVTSRFRSGWLRPTIVAGLVALAVPAVFFVLGVRKKLDGEGWAFLLIMPGLAEELVFRGVQVRSGANYRGGIRRSRPAIDVFSSCSRNTFEARASLSSSSSHALVLPGPRPGGNS